MEAPFPKFKPSSPGGFREFQITHSITLVPLYASLVLMIAQPDLPGPGLWFVFAFSLGLALFLTGVRTLCFTRQAITQWGNTLVARCDKWWPWLAFFSRCGSIALTASMFWLTATHYGLPATIWQHLNFFLLLLAFFIYQLAAAMAVFTELTGWQSAAELIRYIAYTLAALLLGSLITLLTVTPDPRFSPPHEIFLVVLWIGVVMVPVICALLWTNHLLNRRMAADQAGPR